VSISSNDLTTTPYTFDIFGGSGSTIGKDVYEDDNIPQDAKTVSTEGVWKKHTIHRANDVDWSVFEITTSTDVLLQTTGKGADMDRDGVRACLTV
jgi:hypothetical protein